MFVCAAAAEPHPKFVFRFNGHRIVSNSSKYTLAANSTSGTLTVLNLQNSDEGTYTCSAYNRYGSVSTAAVLSVQGKLGSVHQSMYKYLFVINIICGFMFKLTVLSLLFAYFLS